MRACTAAGINISLLPRDCSCGEFAGSDVWGKASFWRLRGICRWAFAGGAVRGRDLFSLAFVGFPVALYGKRSLSPGIFGILHIRYWRGPPPVRN